MRAVIQIMLRGNDASLDTALTHVLRCAADAIDAKRPLDARLHTASGKVTGFVLIEGDWCSPMRPEHSSREGRDSS